MMSRQFVGMVLGLAAGVGLLLVLRTLTTAPVARTRRPGSWSRLIAASGVEHVSPASLGAACVGAALATGVLVLMITAVPVAAIIAAVFAGNVPVLILRRRARVRAMAVSRSWPEAVDMLTSAVRAGLSLPEAVIELGRTGPEPLRPACATFAAEYRATGSFAAALDVLRDSLCDPVADRVVAALRLAREVGGTDLGVVLRTLSGLLREDSRLRGEIEGRQSWTVSAARMSVAAPWITLALLCTRPEAVRAYGSPAGALVLGLAAVLSLIAYRLMLRIGRLPAERRLVA